MKKWLIELCIWAVVLAVLTLATLFHGCTVRAANIQRVPWRLGVIEDVQFPGASEITVATPDGPVWAFAGLVDVQYEDAGRPCLIYRHPLTREWVVGQVVYRRLR